MDKFTIGNEALFSIRLETDGHFASASIFCESEEMGNNDDYTLLKTFISLLGSKIKGYDFFLASEIIHLDKDAVYKYVIDGFEQSDNWKESQRLASIWITLNLTPCFDGEVFILLSNDECDRAIWKQFNSAAVRETFLPPGYVLKQLGFLLDKFYVK